jgi:carboxypeptidase PM20D1
MKYPERLVMSNLWLFAPLVTYMMSLKATTNTAIRTTTAITVLQAGSKDNVLPMSATA